MRLASFVHYDSQLMYILRHVFTVYILSRINGITINNVSGFICLTTFNTGIGFLIDTMIDNI